MIILTPRIRHSSYYCSVTEKPDVMVLAYALVVDEAPRLLVSYIIYNKRKHLALACLKCLTNMKVKIWLDIFLVIKHCLIAPVVANALYLDQYHVTEMFLICFFFHRRKWLLLGRL